MSQARCTYRYGTSDTPFLICGAGEDWRAIGQLAGVDISTLHAYERHMERQTALPVGGISDRVPSEGI